MKRNRISSLVVGSLILSSCIVGACATAETPDIVASSAGGKAPGTAGSSSSGASGKSSGGSAGSIGAAGTSAAGAPAVSGAGGSGATAGGGVAGVGNSGSGGRGGSSGKGGSGGTTGGGTAGAASGGKSGSGGTIGTSGGGSGGRGGNPATGGSGVAGAANGGTGATAGSVGTGTVVKIDLSTFQPAGVGTYNSTSQTLTVMAQPFFQFPLPKTFTTGQSLAVHVTGTNNGSLGIRSWLVNTSQTTLSNLATYVGASLPSGSFTLDYTLTATDAAGLLFFKGPMSGTNIDNVTIASITITY